MALGGVPRLTLTYVVTVMKIQKLNEWPPGIRGGLIVCPYIAISRLYLLGALSAVVRVEHKYWACKGEGKSRGGVYYSGEKELERNRHSHTAAYQLDCRGGYGILAKGGSK